MTRIAIKEVSPNTRDVGQILKDNGFIRDCSDGARRHEILRQHFTTSPANSETLWSKDGRLWLFDGWVADGLKDCCDWKEVWIVDVTDLVALDERGV